MNIQKTKGTKNNSRARKQPDFKMGKRPGKTFLKRKPTNSQQVSGTVVLSITSHQGNGNHNQNERSPVRMAFIKKTKSKCWPGYGGEGTLFTVHGNVNW